MPFQAKQGVRPGLTQATLAAARTTLNFAGRSVDAAFRTLSLDGLSVRGRISTGSLAIAGSTTQAFIGSSTSNTLAGTFANAGHFIWQWGSTTITTATAGTAINFTSAFPNSLLMAQVVSGDASVGNITFGMVTSGYTLAHFTVIAFHNSDTPLNGPLVRVNWLALGN